MEVRINVFKQNEQVLKMQMQLEMDLLALAAVKGWERILQSVHVSECVSPRANIVEYGICAATANCA